MVRVLVVEDSPAVRRLLVHILAGDPELQVVGEAADGAEAVQLAAHLKPDVITMDIRMPVMDGFEATRRIMEQTPRPIVMITASVNPSDVAQTFRAVNAGALAVLEKPEGPQSPHFAKQTASIVSTVKLMAQVKVVSRRPRPALAPQPPPVPTPSPLPGRRIDLVAIAASTGGPAALAAILEALPGGADLPPMLVVQHIAQGFDRGLAEWLDSVTRLSVRLASHGQPLLAGEVTIAPCDFHLGISSNGASVNGSFSNRTAVLSRAEPIGGHRPSATHLFRSVAQACGPRALGVVLTGMGEDGADGALALKQAGGLVLAQNQASCAVYGMPGAAVARGAVDRIVPLDQMAATLLSLVQAQR